MTAFKHPQTPFGKCTMAFKSKLICRVAKIYPFFKRLIFFFLILDDFLYIFQRLKKLSFYLRGFFQTYIFFGKK